MFYGRETERKKLCTMFRSDGQMISLIYGRRRIGKSELIKQVLKETDIKSIYYECKQTTEQNNVESLAELIGEIFDFPKPAFENMEALLEKQNPLYRRIDLTINLKPMDYYESAMFYSGFSEEDKVRLYSVFGGIPYYNRLIDAKKVYGRISLN